MLKTAADLFIRMKSLNELKLHFFQVHNHYGLKVLCRIRDFKKNIIFLLALAGIQHQAAQVILKEAILWTSAVDMFWRIPADNSSTFFTKVVVVCIAV